MRLRHDEQMHDPCLAQSEIETMGGCWRTGSKTKEMRPRYGTLPKLPVLPDYCSPLYSSLRTRSRRTADCSVLAGIPEGTTWPTSRLNGRQVRSNRVKMAKCPQLPP
jgi:hypothetical protein